MIARKLDGVDWDGYVEAAMAVTEIFAEHDIARCNRDPRINPQPGDLLGIIWGTGPARLWVRVVRVGTEYVAFIPGKSKMTSEMGLEPWREFAKGASVVEFGYMGI